MFSNIIANLREKVVNELQNTDAKSGFWTLETE